MGARLLSFAREWNRLTTDQFVRSVVRKGYRIELDSSPSLSPVPIPMHLSRDSGKAQSLRQEIRSLLDKRAIEELDLVSLSPGFYSRIFLVRKKDGDWRPVFDLKSLNQFVRKEKFKMTTPRVVTNALHHGDWVVSVDLKDAYFHIPIHKKSRHLLRFAVETDDGLRVFQFRALPFGLTSAPRVFTKVILPLGHLAHMHAVCLLQYLDDWILRSTDRSLLAQQTNWLLSVMRRVGLVLNVPKSHLVPTQRLTHIGVEYHLDEGLMFPPMERVLKIESKVSLFLSVRAVTAYFWLSLLGLMSSATDAISLGRLHLRPLQFYLLAHWAPASRNLAALIPVKHILLDHHLRWWLDRKCTRSGMLLDIPEARAQLFTDASESGWGAHMDTLQASGLWSAREAMLHINQLEIIAVRNALLAFRTQLTGLPVQLMSDNATVVSYLTKQGGTASLPMYRLAKEVLLLARRAYYPSGQTHSGGEECTSGPSLPTRQGGSHGMDTSLDSSGFTVHHVGQAQCGPVCDSPQQQASGVCVTHGRPPSGRGRCHVDIMEGNVRLCIPPICDAGARAREDPRRSPLRVDPHCSQMAQSVLVRQTIGTAGRLSFGPAPQERSADPATQPSETSVTPSCAPTRLEAVQRSLEERGFSRAAAEQISRGRRQSSRAVYDSKWRIFSRWCSEQSVDPFQISIQKLADFFVFLFHEKGLNPRTIKGYRSAISSTISSCGSRTEFTNSPELASLIRSFQLERPPQRKIAPQWNLSLVLRALLKPPFEPIHACDLKSLNLKTVFLVALASGRRRSEIHALCFDSHHFRQNQDQSLLTLYPDLEFVAKNQVLDSVAEPIKLKAFTAVGSEDFDRKLCPVRALLQYRKVTSSPGCRKGRKKLFIPVPWSYTRFPPMKSEHYRLLLVCFAA